jgi:hypothetical protein
MLSVGIIVGLGLGVGVVSSYLNTETNNDKRK